MNTFTGKRWAVIRKTTGSIVRKFDNRDDARDYKRGTPNLGLFDLKLQMAAR
jgi:hypothetical protein